MKSLLTLCLFLGYFTMMGQSRLIDREGEITFFSDAPLEDIKATSKQAMAVIDTAAQKVAASIQMQSFKFKKSLMQEHFNENYVESEKYPKATFSGKIQGTIDYQAKGKQEATVAGEMSMHGVTQPFEGTVTFDIDDKGIAVTTVFNIALADYEIKIPTLLFNKIAEEVEVTANFSFDK